MVRPKETERDLGKLNRNRKIGHVTIILLVILCFIITIFFYPYLPQKMASHWGASGEVNGFMPKEVSAFLVPLIATVLAFVLYYTPKLDPLQKNIEKFREHYERFIVHLTVFFLFLQVIILLWNVGIQIDFNIVMGLAFALLFFSIGGLVSNSRQNYFIGIRTPWTLASEEVWNHTHSVGGKLFKACAIISLIGVLVPALTLYFILVPIIASAIAIFAYSYFDYKKVTTAKNQKRK